MTLLFDLLAAGSETNETRVYKKNMKKDASIVCEKHG